MSVTKRTRIGLTVLAIFATASMLYASKLAFSWKNANYKGSGFKNILVLAMNGKAISRADFEDRMVKEMSRPGVTVVPSYSLMPRPDATPINLDDLRGYVHDLKFDAIVVSRMVKNEKKTTVVQGDDFPFYPYYGTFYGYYGAIAPLVYAPSYLQTDTDIQVETNLYGTAKPDGELVWSGTTDTEDPRSSTSAIDGIVKVLVKQFEKDKLI
ncbi:MAG TPA: hypothetical protein VMH89_10225 [Candidatus Acidoferrum sp.]|nr:hypothetical protein [Candidatus Acidoferrum sp.]